MRLLLLVSALAALACGQKAPTVKPVVSQDSKVVAENYTTPASTSETVVLVVDPVIVMPGGDMNMTTDNSTDASNATAPTAPSSSSNTTMSPMVEPTPVSEAGTEPTVHVDQTTEPADNTTAHSHPHGNSSAVIITSASAVSLCLISLLVLS